MEKRNYFMKNDRSKNTSTIKLSYLRGNILLAKIYYTWHTREYLLTAFLLSFFANKRRFQFIFFLPYFSLYTFL